MNDLPLGASSATMFYLLDPNPVPDYTNEQWTDSDHVSKDASAFVAKHDWCHNGYGRLSPPDMARVDVKKPIWASCMVGYGGYNENNSPALGFTKAKLGCTKNGLVVGQDPQ